MSSSEIKDVARDYGKYLDLDLENKLEPICCSVEDLLGRLEEVQTLVSPAARDGRDCRDALGSLAERRAELDELCRKVDGLEGMLRSVRGCVEAAEREADRAERELGWGEGKRRVVGILGPLLKRSPEKKTDDRDGSLPVFKADDHFFDSNQG